MRLARTLYGGAPLLMDLKVSATVVAGQPVRWVAGGNANIQGPVSGASNPDAIGLTTDAATYSTTQGSEGISYGVIVDPFAIIRAEVNPSASTATAYAAGDGYLLVADSASAGGTTVADTDTGGTSNDAIDGLIYCISGANAGQTRIVTAHTASTSVVVTVPFDNAIAAGDTFVFSQYAPGVESVDMIDDYTEVSGATAGGTGAEYRCMNVYFDVTDRGTKSSPYVAIDMVSTDHVFNVG